jgi:hypothetical protein
MMLLEQYAGAILLACAVMVIEGLARDKDRYGEKYAYEKSGFHLI